MHWGKGKTPFKKKGFSPFPQTPFPLSPKLFN
jgi:hypothetical protein